MLDESKGIVYIFKINISMDRNMNSQLIQIQLLIIRAYCVRGDPIKPGWNVCHNEDLDDPMQTWSTDDQNKAKAAL